MTHINSYEFATMLRITPAAFSRKMIDGFIPQPTEYRKSKRGADGAWWAKSKVDAFMLDFVERAKLVPDNIRKDRIVKGFGFEPAKLQEIISAYRLKDTPARNWHELTLNTLAKLGAN